MGFVGLHSGASLLASSSSSFVSSSSCSLHLDSNHGRNHQRCGSSSIIRRNAAVSPTMIGDLLNSGAPEIASAWVAHLPHTAHQIQDALTPLMSLLADATGETVKEAASPGVWEKFVGLIEFSITGLHDTMKAAGLKDNSWGVAIILFTVIVKGVTFPLNYKQMASTIKMQALQPRMKAIQTQYRDNPQVMNQMIAEMYQKEQINPLAGCLPVLAQLPIWIALYRAVLNLAEENKLNESFLWLPSLQGPVASSAEGLSAWLFPLVDGAPPIGWHDALCYMVLPVVLVLTQVWSQRILTPPSDDPQMQQTQKILQFLPLLIGWFSLNVPSGLGVYWVINNLLSTGQTIAIRKVLGADQMTAAAAATAASMTSSTDESSAASRRPSSEGFTPGTKQTGSSSGPSKKKKNRR